MQKPDWLKVKIPSGEGVLKTSQTLKGINTICRSALCPNRAECFSNGQATFLILGNICSRNCCFCAVIGGSPYPPDLKEPVKIANAIKQLQLRFAIITSVTRDDLTDGGAIQFVRTIKEIRKITPPCAVEVLLPDFNGNFDVLKKVVNERPNVIGHNLETVKRLYLAIRPGAIYERSLSFLQKIKGIDRKVRTKSGIMVGMGEKKREIISLLEDLRSVDCDMVTIGQYLQPTRKSYPVKEYIHPKVFDELKEIANDLGFLHVEAGPLVRSSYHAFTYFDK